MLSVGCPHGYILTTNPNDVDTFLCQCDFTDPGIVNCDGTVITIDVSVKVNTDYSVALM